LTDPRKLDDVTHAGLLGGIDEVPLREDGRTDRRVDEDAVHPGQGTLQRVAVGEVSKHGLHAGEWEPLGRFRPADQNAHLLAARREEVDQFRAHVARRATHKHHRWLPPRSHLDTRRQASVERLEDLFAEDAFRAQPIIGQVLEGRSGGDPVVRVTERRVVHV
jgi:hypothetical protein